MNHEQALAKIKKSRDFRSIEDNRQWIAEVERDLEKLKTDDAFLKTDQVKALKLRIKSIIVSASKRLIDEDEPSARLRIKADRDAYTWLLRYFSKDVDKEMQEIEDKLNEKLEAI